MLGHAGPSCPLAAAVSQAEPKEEFDANESSLQKAEELQGLLFYRVHRCGFMRRPLYFLLHCLPLCKALSSASSLQGPI